MVYVSNDKDFETTFLLNQIWTSKHTKRTSRLFSFNTEQNQKFTIFKVAADATHKGK